MNEMNPVANVSHYSVPQALITRPKAYELVKRAVDIGVSGVGLVLIAPIFSVVAVLVRLDSKGPIFFRQTRIGQFGEAFSIIKFRTMVVNAEQVGPQVTSSDDPRMTRIGKLLRSTKIDELPQLINVLTGEMSLVGPRPQVPRYAELFPDHQKATIFSVRPGITGPAAIKFRHEEEILQNREDREDFYIQVLLPIKCSIDEEYVETRSLGKDAMVVWETVKILSRGVLNRIRRRPMGQHIDYPVPSYATITQRDDAEVEDVRVPVSNRSSAA